MLPLNQLEALSEAHAEIIKRKDELDEKMLRLEFEKEIEKLTSEALEDAESKIMEAVKKGFKGAVVWAYEPCKGTNKYFRFYFNKTSEENRNVGNRVIKELQDQGFKTHISNTGHYGKTEITINWANFHPNANYEQPNHKEVLKKLDDKISKLAKLNEQADTIIAE